MKKANNVIVDGFTFNVFTIELKPTIKIQCNDVFDANDELKFINNILPELLYVLGTLGGTFYLHITVDHPTFRIVITLPAQCLIWMTEFADMMSSFQNNAREFVAEPIRIRNTKRVLPDGFSTYYMVKAKDGVFIEKKRNIITKTLQQVDNERCNCFVLQRDEIIPLYSVEKVDF